MKRAGNDAIRDGSRRPPTEPFYVRVTSLGAPTMNLDRALQIAGELEDSERVRAMRTGR